MSMDPADSVAPEPPEVGLEQRLAALDVDALRRTYLSAQPWPHLVLDGLFDDGVLAAAAAEAGAIAPDHLEVAITRNMVKRETAEAAHLGRATSAVLDALDRPAFLSFLEAITGIPDLSPDPVRHWAGFHETPPGGFTNVHADFERHPESGLYHRTNVLLYLNEQWDERWGGLLELWPPDMSACGRRIVPLANRLVLFETNADTLHGLPAPVRTPDGRSRISLAAYQFSPVAPPVRSRRLSKYAARPEDSWRVSLPTRWDLRERVPEPVRRLVRATRRRSNERTTPR